MMRGLFYSLPLHFAKTECSLRIQPCIKILEYPCYGIELCLENKHGQENSCSWMCLTILLAESTKINAPQSAVHVMHGVPCKFPFVYPDCSVCINCCSGGLTPKQYNKCGSDISGDWCYTRTYLNDSAIIGEWGYCDPSCNGEVHFNLASIENDDLWSEDIFRIQVYSSGHCHTYNPADLSFSGDRGSFYAKLG